MSPAKSKRTKNASRRPTAPTLREEQKVFTRQRLVEAAIDAFEKHGYAATTVEDITKAANASRATFYLHFEDKADVVLAITEMARPDVEEYYADLDRAIETGSPAELRRWMRDALAWFNENHALSIALERVVTGGGDLGGKVSEWFNFTDFMPHYMDQQSPRNLVQARLRVWLLVTLLSVTWRVDHAMPDVDEEMVADVLSEIWAVPLGFNPKKAAAKRRKTH